MFKSYFQNLIQKISVYNITLLVFGFSLFLFTWLGFSHQASAASFSVTPSTGTYSVGSTFDVSVILDTEGKDVNAVQMTLLFPPDKLQLVSPQVGNSIIEVYTTPPRYDNTAGNVTIIGGIPNGINVKNGLISKLTFRVRSLGSATIRFGGDSQALLNDGRGTNALNNADGATLKLELPPSQGPLVLSDSHPDQETWYRDSNVSLHWDDGLPPAQGYSYMISDNPTDVPDDTPESNNTSVEYKTVPDGINYFHIKALRDGRWGGITRYTLRIDTAPPADFKILVTPSARTFVTKPVLQFASTDALSGFDRFEIKIISLKIDGRSNVTSEGELFTEAQSPFQTPDLLYGNYDIIVRAYDKAGNNRDVTQRVEITNSPFWFIGSEGITLLSGNQVSWGTIFPITGGLLLLLLIIAYFIYHRYKYHHKLATQYAHPDHIEEKLAELQYYRQKYGKIAAILLFTIALSASVLLSNFGLKTNLVKAENIAPPTIETYSKNIKDDELFYVSGRTVDPNTDVVVHLQSTIDGQAFDYTTTSDKRGDWTYQNKSFLAGGKYIVWAHAKNGAELSAPSPQVELDVKPVAIHWGGSRVTYQTVYLVAISILTLTVVLLAIFIIIGLVLVRRRRRQFAETVKQAEDGLNHGFMAIKRDLEAELALMQRATMGGDMAGEANVRAEQLRQDLKNIEDLISREESNMERFAGLPSNPAGQ